jgi:SNF family Na+-dependent transporter
MMVLEGMPLLLLELGIGQRLCQGSLGVWNVIHPYLGGIGLGSSVIAIIVACYYNMIIAWCFFYLGNSIRVNVYSAFFIDVFCTDLESQSNPINIRNVLVIIHSQISLYEVSIFKKRVE